jgi:hypothetical protein
VKELSENDFYINDDKSEGEVEGYFKRKEEFR